MKSWVTVGLVLLVVFGGVSSSRAGTFDTPELQVVASPQEMRSLALGSGEKPIDTDVSSQGAEVVVLVQLPNGTHVVRFWRLDGSQPVNDWPVPREFAPRAIAWHPLGDRLFLAGTQGGQHSIARVGKISGNWEMKTIYRSAQEIRRLVVGPRPYVIAYDKQMNPSEGYRVFFGLKGADGNYAIRSITEEGRKDYQVVGPKSGFTVLPGTEGQPSKIAAGWALPLGFHPAGHLLIWEDNQKGFHVASYGRDCWDRSRRLLDGAIQGGSVTATPNGLGLLHWKPDTDGITVVLDQGRTKGVQAEAYRFVGTPSSVPDGRGVVGVVRRDKDYSLVYVPIEVPLAKVTNAWMFVESSPDRELIGRNGGLLRDLAVDQLYSLYDSEAYSCGDYDSATPTRPYLVTTDIFWELLAAAYEGLFIITERHQAIPAFWELVAASEQHFRTTQPDSPWAKVFATLTKLRGSSGKEAKDPEVQRILAARGGEKSPLLGVELNYGELLPRGHYTGDPEFQKYFKAFKYLTELAPEAAPVEVLQNVPDAIKGKALQWIAPYQRFIAPPRAPLVWAGGGGDLPVYARHPLKEARLFPLSWGFDNEVLLSTVYHPDWPESERITGPAGQRMMPSARDVAAAMGSKLAMTLLRDDLDRYPPLRTVLEELSKRRGKLGSENAPTDLYNNWLDALAMQWADDVASPNAAGDEALWRSKRLQTGLASWATLRHATVLVNERTMAECGEAGFEPIVLRPPRGYVEPDPRTFEAVAALFDSLLAMVKSSEGGVLRGEMTDEQSAETEPLRQGIARRLQATAEKARLFKAMAAKEVRREALSGSDYEEILHVGRVAEHHFLVFKSLANKEFALSNPDPMAKIADVAGGGPLNLPYLMAAVGRPMEWDHVVPFYGRSQMVKGSVYSFYEFISERLLDDAAWRQMLGKQEHPAWIAPFLSRKALSCPARNPF
ncbi:MAG TPA: hypothetical protein DCE18_04520 [Syntrophobacteraceae bacterium]|nr:hypothetical protein [Syntrophobacteraceae bacterium]